MNKSFATYLLLIFNSLSVFSQTLSMPVKVEINEENKMQTMFVLQGIKDSMNISNLHISSIKVDEEQIFPLKKENLTTNFSWTSSYGYSSGKTMLYIQYSPFFIDNNGDIAQINTISIDVEATKNNQSSKTVNYKEASTSVLATGKWYKYGVTKESVYKLDYKTLQQQGIAVNEISSVNEIKVFSNGGRMLPYANNISVNDDLTELAVKHVDNGDAVFNDGDYILFYGQSTLNWNYDNTNQKFVHVNNIFSDTSYYYLTFNHNSPKEIIDEPLVSTYNQSFTSFLDRQVHESDERNLLRSGTLWLGDHFAESGTMEFDYHFKNTDTSLQSILTSRLYAKNQSPGGSNFNVKVNNESSLSSYIASVSGNNADDVAKNALNIYPFKPTSDTLKSSFTYNAVNSTCEAWIDYFELNVYRKLIYEKEALFFRNPNNIGMGNKSQFKIAQAQNNLTLWNITNFEKPSNINYNLNGDSIEFKIETDTLLEFVLFNDSNCITPLYLGKIDNQNLHGLVSKNMLIICPKSFFPQAQRLASFHEQQDGISVHVVSIEEVYNEFCKGTKDVSGIRNFVKMLYNRGTNGSDSLKYLLLLGDGTFDYKNINESNLNLIPTFQSANSTKETASYTSDDFFALLDDNEGGWTVSSSELPDVAVGRIPAKNIDEAKIVIDKIFSYSNYFDGLNNNMLNDKAHLFSNWKNEIIFIGDDEDFNIHQKQANQLAAKVENNYPQINVDKIYLDSYKQNKAASENSYPEAQKDLLDKINKGVFLLNYTGHGGEDGLASEKLITSHEIKVLENGIKLPLVFTATCDFSRYDMINANSAGEEFLLNPKGGAIALYSTTRVVYSSPNFNLNNNFYNIIFDFHQGEKTTIGDIFKDTKVLNNGGLNDRNFTLLGDPALRLTIPHKGMKTKVNSIINAVSNITTDTLKALMKIKISGEITDTVGNKQNDFNGYLYSKIFDKNIPYTTLMNDGGSAFQYNLQHNVLFEGKSSIVNGGFSFEFMIPKDIAYHYDLGKMSFYAVNSNHQELADWKKIVIGGTEPLAEADNTGPEIKLFMNDSTFVFGEATNSAPLLIAILSDSSGINITSENVGHDITAVIDGESTKTIRLSSYYQYTLNSYQEGKLQYKLSELNEGRHSIEVKAYDNYNNSSRAYTEFIVAGDAKIALHHVLNYPNPFTTQTAFYFEHNQPGKTLDITIQIFTISGKLVKTIRENIFSENIRVGPIQWNGLDDYGDAIGKGVYIYQILVKGEDGSNTQRYEKLVLLK